MSEFITQDKMVREHLESGKSITSLEALLLYSIIHLARRIKNLKEDKLDIQDEFIHVVKKNGQIATVKKYFLKEFSDIHKTK